MTEFTGTRSWLLRVIKWDGLLPALIWSAPMLVKLLFPNQRGPIEVVAIVLPIIAFFVRLRAGGRAISTNNCGVAMRRIQYLALYIGIIVLVMIDAVMILAHIMPQGAIWNSIGDIIIWTILFSTYFGLMTFAMYPG